jgi:peptidoglycan-N-acetylglucosamine deacetylase
MLRTLAFSFLALASCVRAEQATPSTVTTPAAPAQPGAPSTPATSPAPPAPAATSAPAANATARPVVAATVPAPSTKAPRISISQCNVDGPFIAMTFDDGPHGAQTPRLLKMLKDRGLKATFFVVGQCVAAEPEIARQIVAEGHEIANHSWSHPLLTKIGEDSVRDQLQRTHDVVKQETGVTMTLMRPPYGGFTTNQKSWAFKTWGYRCILWDVDSLDWQHRSPAKTQSIILNNTRAGSIVLCHDIHKSTVDAMPATLDGLIAKGFKFVTTSELLKMHKEGAAAPAKTPAAKTLSTKEGAEAVTSLRDLQAPGTVPAKPKAAVAQ